MNKHLNYVVVGMGIRIPVRVRVGSFGYLVFRAWKLGPVRVLQNFGPGSSRVLPGPGGFGSDAKKPENNRITNVSETGLDNNTQSNHIWIIVPKVTILPDLVHIF